MTTGQDSKSAVEIETGTLIGQRYRVERRLDQAVGVASFLARQVALDRLVVVHIFDGRKGSKSDFRQQFEYEARALVRLRHERVASLLDHGHLANGCGYIVCESLDGPTLAEYMASHQIGLEACLRLALDVCSALEESHRLGIIHRDINPSNIIITQSKNELRATLSGFGFHHYRQDVGLHTGTNPSVLMKDARADLYGLGAVIYQCLAGHPMAGMVQAGSLKTRLIERFGEQDERVHQLRIVLLNLLQLNEDGQLSTARQLASQLSRIQGIKTENPENHQQLTDEPATFKGAPIKDRKTDPIGSRAPSKNRFHGGHSQWIPRWSYIVGLGLISLSVIGLTRIQDLANQQAGRAHTRQLDRQRTELTIPVNEFLEISKRHLELGEGILSPQRWTDTRVLWSETILSADNADFGLVKQPMSDALDELKKGLYELEKGRSLHTPLTQSHLYKRAAFRWQQANLVNPKKPDYRPAIPVLEQIVTGRSNDNQEPDGGHRDVWTARYYLSVALASIKQLTESQAQLDRLLDQGTGIVTDLARIQLLMNELEHEETHLLDAHLALAMNSKIRWVRYAAQYVKILRSWRRGLYEDVLDQCFTFLETTTNLNSQARHLRPLVFEFMIMTASRIDRGDLAVQSFIRGYGGQDLVRYYLPLQALAYASVGHWSAASKSYSSQLAIASSAAAEMSQSQILRRAEAFIRAGHENALHTIKDQLAKICNAEAKSPHSTHFACRHLRADSEIDGGPRQNEPP